MSTASQSLLNSFNNYSVIDEDIKPLPYDASTLSGKDLHRIIFEKYGIPSDELLKCDISTKEMEYILSYDNYKNSPWDRLAAFLDDEKRNNVLNEISDTWTQYSPNIQKAIAQITSIHANNMINQTYYQCPQVYMDADADEFLEMIAHNRLKGYIWNRGLKRRKEEELKHEEIVSNFNIYSVGVITIFYLPTLGIFILADGHHRCLYISHATALGKLRNLKDHKIHVCMVYFDSMSSFIKRKDELNTTVNIHQTDNANDPNHLTGYWAGQLKKLLNDAYYVEDKFKNQFIHLIQEYRQEGSRGIYNTANRIRIANINLSKLTSSRWDYPELEPWVLENIADRFNNYYVPIIDTLNAVTGDGKGGANRTDYEKIRKSRAFMGLIMRDSLTNPNHRIFTRDSNNPVMFGLRLSRNLATVVEKLPPLFNKGRRMEDMIKSLEWFADCCNKCNAPTDMKNIYNSRRGTNIK